MHYRIPFLRNKTPPAGVSMSAGWVQLYDLGKIGDRYVVLALVIIGKSAVGLGTLVSKLIRSPFFRARI